MNIRKELLQECKTLPDLFGEGGILKQLTTTLKDKATVAMAMPEKSPDRLWCSRNRCIGRSPR